MTSPTSDSFTLWYASDIYYDRMFYGFYDLFHFRLVNFVVEFRSAVYYGLRCHGCYDLVHAWTKATSTRPTCSSMGWTPTNTPTTSRTSPNL